jgi:phospholipase C
MMNDYDFGLTVVGHEHFQRRYAGRIETGQDSISDPCMGRVV